MHSKWAGRRLAVCLTTVVLAACGDDVTGESESDSASGSQDSGDTEPTGGPPVGVKLEWSWTTNEVTVLPLVADIMGDERPEVVVNAMRTDGLDRIVGEIVLLDGTTGAELWRVAENPQGGRHGSLGTGTPALGDFNGDGRSDIVYPGRGDPGPASSYPTAVHAIDGTGEHLWTGHTAEGALVTVDWNFGAAVVANLDDDPEAEIAVGGALFDNDGLLVWNQDDKDGELGSPTDNKASPKLLYVGGLPTFADLTGDGKPELVTGREAWTILWTPGSPPNVSMELLWRNTDGSGNDGWPAIADFDQNGTPEVVLVAWPDIKVLDGRTGQLWCGVDPTGVMCEGDDTLRTQPIPIKGGNLGGPATIADFDGDGRPEAGIVGGTAYAVYDFHRPGEELVVPNGDPTPAPGAMYVRWASEIQDSSSASTASSVFDFEGDGSFEVVHQDECKLRILDGATGATRFEELNSSGTVHEYPPVVDVDGDGNAEFLAVANLSESFVNVECQSSSPKFVPRQGVFAYGGEGQEWVPTRRLWTQHTYHVTNAGSNGHPPFVEDPHWTVFGLNSFRQNVQGEAP